MKKALTLLLIVLKLTVLGQKATFHALKTFSVDLNNDNLPDTVFLTSSLTDSLSFNRIIISINGFGKYTFDAQNAWTKVDSLFLVTNTNAINTKNFFLYKEKDHSVILLFGYLGGAGYRQDFSIINIKDNKTKMVYDKREKDFDIERPIKLTDLDNDGRTDFIFRNLFEYYERVDSINADLGTYSPYFVYTISNDCKLNKDLTKKYNEDNYVFAGFEYNEFVEILYPRNGKNPSIFIRKK